MKILLAASYNYGNPFIKESVEGMRLFCDVDTSKEIFLQCQNNGYDVLHLQWPEYYCQINKITKKSIKDFENKLIYWKKHTKIVFTRHNILPHMFDNLIKSKKNLVNDLYRLFYEYCDGVIHLGEYSLNNYPEYYKNKSLHCIIPHGMYKSYLKSKSKNECRNELDIDHNKKVILVFGRVRKFAELKLILKTLNKLPKEYIVLCPGLKYITTIHKYRNRLKNLLKFVKGIIFLPIRGFTGIQVLHNIYSANQWLIGYKMIDKMNSVNRRFYWGTSFINDDDIQLYFMSANVVFIPRKGVLNSGVIPLAFYYSLPVVAPNCGNVTELISSSNNYIYEEGKSIKAKVAIEKCFNNRPILIGENNYQFGIKYLNWEHLGGLHFNFYKKLLFPGEIENF